MTRGAIYDCSPIAGVRSGTCCGTVDGSIGCMLSRIAVRSGSEVSDSRCALVRQASLAVELSQAFPSRSLEFMPGCASFRASVFVEGCDPSFGCGPNPGGATAKALAENAAVSAINRRERFMLNQVQPRSR